MYARKFTSRLLPALVAAAFPLSALVATPASADGGQGAVTLLTTIPVPGTPLRGFDISWIDQSSQLYYLADRSNAAVDVADAKASTFVRQIKATPPFAGVKFNANNAANNNISGPNGVVVAGRWLFVSDAGSRVVTIDLTNDKTVSDVKTDATSPNRADEMAYDPDDGILLAINNADDPPFGTLIKVDKGTGKLTVGARITLDAAHVGFDATNGAEQPQYSRRTGKFYLSIPEVNCTGNPNCGGGGPDGGVAQIDPHSTGHVDHLFPVAHCQPAGLTMGPDDKALVGCSVAFDTAGNAWSAADANSARPESVVLDVVSGAQVRVAGATGSDEVWYNRGDGNYYLAARNNPGGPVMGVINAKTNTLAQLVPTLNTAAKTTAPPFPAATAHSLAADSHNNHVLVPIGADNVFPNCLNGCIAVFARPANAED